MFFLGGGGAKKIRRSQWEKPQDIFGCNENRNDKETKNVVFADVRVTVRDCKVTAYSYETVQEVISKQLKMQKSCQMDMLMDYYKQNRLF